MWKRLLGACEWMCGDEWNAQLDKEVLESQGGVTVARTPNYIMGRVSRGDVGNQVWK